jgi:hypothetical protein
VTPLLDRIKGKVVSGYGIDRQHRVVDPDEQARACQCWNEGQYGRVHREDCPLHSTERHTTFSLFFEDGTYIAVQPSQPVPVDLSVSFGSLPKTVEFELDQDELGALRTAITASGLTTTDPALRSAREKLLQALGGA